MKVKVIIFIQNATRTVCPRSLAIPIKTFECAQYSGPDVVADTRYKMSSGMLSLNLCFLREAAKKIFFSGPATKA